MTQSEDKLFQQIVQAGMDTERPSEDLRHRVLAAALSAQQEAAELVEDAAIAQDSTQPAVRPVPDVPTEQADGVQRGPHPIEQPPRRRHTRWRFVTMFQKRSVRWSMAAAVAAAVVLVVGLWPSRDGGGPGRAFAAAVKQFQKAKTIVCQFSSPTPTSVMGMNIVSSGKWYMSAEYGTRFENYANGILVNVMIVPPEGPAVSITPPGRRYTILDVNQPDRSNMNSPDAFIRSMMTLTNQPDRQLGKAIIDGMEAYGYEISAQSMGFGETPNARSELWVDAHTFMPVRYVIEWPGFEPNKTITYVFDQFEWDVPLDSTLFDTTMPPGYTRVNTQLHTPDEASLINCLRLYAEWTGEYPSALSMPRVVGGLMASGSAKGNKLPANPEQQSIEIGIGVVFYMELASKGCSPEYHGATVSPGQKDAVLVQWKTEDGQWRVIYGDLRVETLPNRLVP